MCQPPAMSVNRPSASNGGPEDFPYPAPDRQSHRPITFPACVSTRAPRRRRPGRRPPLHMLTPPARSTDCTAASNGGGGDSPARHLGADGHCAFPVALPRPFWACHHLLCRSSAGGDGVPSSVGNSTGTGRRSHSPHFAPLSAIQLQSCR